MNACLFLLFLLSGVGRTDPTVTGREGGNLTHGCSFFLSGKTKFFCTRECGDGDVLIKTDQDRDQRGRYSIEYKEAPGLLSSYLLYVTITNLKTSDSGLYRCGLGRYWLPDSKKDFEVRVENASVTSKPNRTPRLSSTSVPSASTAWSSGSGSGASTPSSASPEQRPTAGAAQTTTGTLLTAGLTLVVMAAVLSAALLVLCRKKASEPKGHPVEMDYAYNTEPNRVYEEIGEGGSPPPEITTIYSCVQHIDRTAAEPTDGVSAAAPQQKPQQMVTALFKANDAGGLQ